MTDFFKHYISILFHAITRFFCVFPIDSRKIIFEAYMGEKYACSPKSICEYIDSKTKKYHLIWVYNKVSLPCEYEQIKRNSLVYFYHMLTAKFVIINSGKNNLLSFRQSQVIINTWHGGGAYKKVKILGPAPHYKKNVFFISSCEKASQFVIREGQSFYGEILNFGLPRNDTLFHFDSKKARSVKEKMNIRNRKCVLYAPTFRKELSRTEFALDYNRLLASLQKRFGGEWVILMRNHYHMRPIICNSNVLNMIDVTQYPDMQDLLLVSDVLITDYSSSIWDYSFLNRPAFLYATDLKEYDQERSFFVDIHEWPFPLCENNDELVKAIETFDQEIHKQAIERHHNYMGSFEAGNASERTFEFIEQCNGSAKM